MIKDNVDLEQIISIHNDKATKIEYVKINETVFYTEQLQTLFSLLQESFHDYKIIIEFKYKISRRRALIVILEENFHNLSQYNENLKLSVYENEAKIRFSINNSSRKDLDTPTKIHPKNPWIYYNDDEMAFLKRQYLDAIRDLLQTPHHYFLLQEAIDSLTRIYIKLSSDTF